LAPHGVPSNPIPRALSSTRLHDMASNDYGATYHAGPNLDIPGTPSSSFIKEGFQINLASKGSILINKRWYNEVDILTNQNELVNYHCTWEDGLESQKYIQVPFGFCLWNSSCANTKLYHSKEVFRIVHGQFIA
jgi:hypothetical protein